MKREMSKNKKKVEKSTRQSKRKRKKERKKKQNKHHLFDFGQLISTSANFDFGQFDFGPLAEVELAEVEHPRLLVTVLLGVRSWPPATLPPPT